MDETDRPDDRRAAGSWVLPNSESRRQRNHEAAKSGIQKRKKTKTYPPLSCKIEYLLTSNHSDGSIASEFFTGDLLEHDRLGLNRSGIPIGRILIQDAGWTEVSIYGPSI